jgi:hypothetical protein
VRLATLIDGCYSCYSDKFTHTRNLSVDGSGSDISIITVNSIHWVSKAKNHSKHYDTDTLSQRAVFHSM